MFEPLDHADDFGVEPSPLALANGRYCFGRTIRGGKDFERLAHIDNACQYGNLGSLAMFWIAASVPVLIEAPDCFSARFTQSKLVGDFRAALAPGSDEGSIVTFCSTPSSTAFTKRRVKDAPVRVFRSR